MLNQVILHDRIQIEYMYIVELFWILSPKIKVQNKTQTIEIVLPTFNLNDEIEKKDGFGKFLTKRF